MNYYKKTLSTLKQVGDEKYNKVISVCFAFGSSVMGDTFPRSYRETQVFKGPDFLMSKFDLVDVSSDIDVLCVANDLLEAKSIFNQIISDLVGHHVTINIITKATLEKEIFSAHPSAIKRVLLYRELLVIKGEEQIKKMKDLALSVEKPGDRVFQKEFDFKKEYLRMFAKYDIASFSFDKVFYEQFFPNLLKFISGDLRAGFPDDRIKIVYPQSMNLKYIVDLAKGGDPHRAI